MKHRAKTIDGYCLDWVKGYYVKDPQGRHRIYLQPFYEATSNTWYLIQPDTLQRQCSDGEYRDVDDTITISREDLLKEYARGFNDGNQRDIEIV